jgi:hypothetical protein
MNHGDVRIFRVPGDFEVIETAFDHLSEAVRMIYLQRDDYPAASIEHPICIRLQQEH